MSRLYESEPLVLNRLAQLALAKGTDEGRKITQKTVAKEVGISESTVANYWNNKNVLDDKRIVAKLLVWLNIKIGEFYYTKDSDSSELNDDDLEELIAPLLAHA